MFLPLFLASLAVASDAARTDRTRRLHELRNRLGLGEVPEAAGTRARVLQVYQRYGDRWWLRAFATFFLDAWAQEHGTLERWDTIRIPHPEDAASWPEHDAWGLPPAGVQSRFDPLLSWVSDALARRAQELEMEQRASGHVTDRSRSRWGEEINMGEPARYTNLLEREVWTWITNALNATLDYLEDQHPNLGTFTTFRDLYDAQRAWHEGFAARNPGMHTASPGVVVMRWADGWRIERLVTRVNLDDETDVMDHCVSTHWPSVADGRAMVFSVRDPDGASHATLELDAYDRSVNDLKGPNDVEYIPGNPGSCLRVFFATYRLNPGSYGTVVDLEVGALISRESLPADLVEREQARGAFASEGWRAIEAKWGVKMYASAWAAATRAREDFDEAFDSITSARASSEVVYRIGKDYVPFQPLLDALREMLREARGIPWDAPVDLLGELRIRVPGDRTTWGPEDEAWWKPWLDTLRAAWKAFLPGWRYGYEPSDDELWRRLEAMLEAEAKVEALGLRSQLDLDDEEPLTVQHLERLDDWTMEEKGEAIGRARKAAVAWIEALDQALGVSLSRLNRRDEQYHMTPDGAIAWELFTDKNAPGVFLLLQFKDDKTIAWWTLRDGEQEKIGSGDDPMALLWEHGFVQVAEQRERQVQAEVKANPPASFVPAETVFLADGKAFIRAAQEVGVVVPREIARFAKR